jgi:dGTPase
MDWNKLLDSNRRKDFHNNGTKKLATNTGTGRAEIERDYDRILFSTPIRRLADKTQVFPLDKNDSVRTRLTHSHEVANLARGIGTRLVFDSKEEFFGTECTSCLERDVPSLLAAIGLAHDLGNPPFGHQGESAIRSWFEKKKKDTQIEFHNDFLKFDGNSQTLRLLTKLQILNDNFGLNLTYATLLALIKYPVSSENVGKKGPWKKHGFFKSEEDVVNDLWTKMEIKEGIRHPLTYIMEACDDIAYSVLDAEDTVKKGFASFYDLVDHLEYWRKNEESDDVINHVVKKVKAKNLEFKKEKLSPSELNDMSMQMFRVFAIHELVNSVVDALIKNKDQILSDSCNLKDIISVSKGNELCSALKDFDRRWGYNNKSVLKLELEGFNYIHNLMDMMWEAIHGRLDTENKKVSHTPFSKYVYQKISENYRRVFEDENNSMTNTYKEAQLLTDAISGMTDSYLIQLHNELMSLRSNE